MHKARRKWTSLYMGHNKILSGEKNTCFTLFLTVVLSQMSFPCKVFDEATFKCIKRYVYSFFFTRIFFHMFSYSMVLTRHIIYGHPKGSVIKYYSVDVHYNKKLLTHYFNYFPHYEDDHNIHNLHIYNHYFFNILVSQPSYYIHVYD